MDKDGGGGELLRFTLFESPNPFSFGRNHLRGAKTECGEICLLENCQEAEIYPRKEWRLYYQMRLLKA